MYEKISVWAAMAAGLVISQLIGFIFVWCSNLALYESLISLRAAGYFPVPNVIVMKTLTKLSPAFAGGLFFTLSIGVFLVTGTLLFLWGRHQIHRGKIVWPILGIGLTAGMAFWVNRNGFALYPTLFVFIIPTVTYIFGKGNPDYPLNEQAPASHIRARAFAFILPLVILASLWWRSFDDGMFTRFRDRVLMATTIGRGINDFYYDFTLYAAESFKSLEQKTLKTYRFGVVRDADLRLRVETILRNHDYLHVPGFENADLTIDEANGRLWFQKNGRLIISPSTDGFSDRPIYWLAELSKKTDLFQGFRILCFYGMLFGLPVWLYLILFNLTDTVLSLFISRRISVLATGGLCLIAGMLPLGLMTQISGKTGPPAGDVAEVDHILSGGDWKRQATALDRLIMHPRKIDTIINHEILMKSPYPQIRYRYAKALGKSHHIRTLKPLYQLLDDPHRTVAYMALKSLGNRKDPKASDVIYRRLQTEPDWYIQGYAYRALRKLHWVQPGLQ